MLKIHKVNRLIFGLLFIAAIAGCFYRPHEFLIQANYQPGQSGLGPNRVEFPASDGFKLTGQFYSNDGTASSAAVILINHFGSNPAHYTSLRDKLLHSGYEVLAYDIRGHGDNQSVSASSADSYKDVLGAVEFLKKAAPGKKIGIIGASAGANIAFVGSGASPEILATVLLSPAKFGFLGQPLPENLPGFNIQNILILSDQQDFNKAETFYLLANNFKEQKIYPGFGHGGFLLNHPEVNEAIIAFLNKRLK